VQNLPKNIKSKFLSVKNDQYEVVKEIKSKLIFSAHNLNRAPISSPRYDLLSQSNDLLYSGIATLGFPALPLRVKSLRPINAWSV
jgi:chemotaxis methyl-accepting protein methylase